MNWKRLSALLLISISVLASVEVYQAMAIAASNTNTTVEPGSGTADCDELVYPSGSNFYARNGQSAASQSGGNDVSGTDAKTVLSTALQNVVTAGGGVFCVKQGSYTLTTQWTQDFNGKAVRLKMYGAVFVSSVADAIVFYDGTAGSAIMRIEGGQLQPPASTTVTGGGLLIGEDASYNSKAFGTGTSIVDFSVIRNGGGFRYPFVFRTNQGDFRIVNSQFYAAAADASAIACLMGGPGTFAYVENEICQAAAGIGIEFGNAWGKTIEGIPTGTFFSDAWIKIDCSNSALGMNVSAANRDFVWADIETVTNGIWISSQGSFNTIYAFITGISGSRVYGQLGEGNYIYDKAQLPYGKVASFAGTGTNNLAFSPFGTTSTVAASTTYTVTASAISNFTSTGGTGVVLTINPAGSLQDGQTNCLVCGAASVTDAFLPVGTTVNFGAFSVAPTVRVVFSAG